MCRNSRRFECNNDRLAVIEIGNPRRKHLGCSIESFHSEVCQYRSFQFSEDGIHLRFDLAGAADVRECPSSEFRRLSHEMTIRRRTDADREEPARAQLGTDHLEQLVLVAHLSIGQKDYLPKVRRGRSSFESHLQGRKNLRAPVRMKLLDIM